MINSSSRLIPDQMGSAFLTSLKNYLHFETWHFVVCHFKGIKCGIGLVIIKLFFIETNRLG